MLRPRADPVAIALILVAGCGVNRALEQVSAASAHIVSLARDMQVTVVADRSTQRVTV